ncbi:MAG: cell division protein SepF [Thermoanaerobacterales bacterium]|nr:cell division protein SepF [Bacillota bacterium]MDI6906515.1 cell division protein SepF [Thermoanaerobacterales bacterium]
MAKLMDKVLGFIGFDEEEPAGDHSQPERQAEEAQEGLYNAPSKKKGAVLSLHSQRQMRVVVTEPRTFDEVQEIADHLKNRRPVVVNLEKAEADLARRIVDFLMGTTYGLNGGLQKVGAGIFLFVPSNVDIDGTLKGTEPEKGLFSWMKL